MKIFAIRDSKAGHFVRPFTELSSVSAIRNFETAVRKGDSQLSSYPDDFELCEIGFFNQDTGVVSSCDISVLCRPSDFLKSAPVGAVPH